MGTDYKWVLALIAPFLLAGCLLIPGKFESQLRLKNDGTYSFTYNGEMQMPEDDDQSMSSQSAMAGDKTDSEDAANKAQANNPLSAMFGRAVPGNDESMKEFAAQLAKYDGWNRVEYMGDNVFEVEYAISGRFDQMFAFPTVPGATMQFPFVQIIRRSGGELEVLTPAMAGPGGLAGAMGSMPMGSASKQPKMQPIDGTFTIVTDGEVLGNNSEDGLALDGSTKTVRWKVDGMSGPDGSPRAIIKLDR